MSTSKPTATNLSCPRCSAESAGAPGTLCSHDGAVLVPTETAARFPDDTVLGQVLGNDLRVFDVLADTGGFGRVYRALQPALDREVVVKVLRPEAAAQPEARARLVREARLLARLSHEPAIVTVHDCVQTYDGLMCLVMERAPGVTLARVLDAGPLSSERARAVLITILGALESAHALGLVHRDLKPDNVLIEGDTVTLIDFGIAKDLAPAEDDVRTASGVHLGTPRYMAPEQLQRDGQLGPATDIYAAGVLLYEMLLGHTPFQGNAAELVAAHLYRPPPAVADATLDLIVQRAMRKRPEDRYASAAAMCAALRSVDVARPAPAMDRTREGTMELPSARPSRRKWAVAAMGLLIVSVVGIWSATRTTTPEPTPQATIPQATAPQTTALEPAANASKTSRDAAPAVAVNPSPGLADATVLDVAVALAKPRDATVDAVRIAASPKPRRKRPKPKRPTPVVELAAPPTVPSAKPADISALRTALKVCRCDQARKILTRIKGTTDHNRWQGAVRACSPRLIGRLCEFSEP